MPQHLAVKEHLLATSQDAVASAFSLHIPRGGILVFRGLVFVFSWEISPEKGWPSGHFSLKELLIKKTDLKQRPKGFPEKFGSRPDGRKLRVRGQGRCYLETTLLILRIRGRFFPVDCPAYRQNAIRLYRSPKNKKSLPAGSQKPPSSCGKFSVRAAFTFCRTLGKVLTRKSVMP